MGDEGVVGSARAARAERLRAAGRDAQLDDERVLDAAEDAPLRLDVLDLLQPDNLGLGEHL